MVKKHKSKSQKAKSNKRIFNKNLKKIHKKQIKLKQVKEEPYHIGVNIISILLKSTKLVDNIPVRIEKPKLSDHFCEIFQKLTIEDPQETLRYKFAYLNLTTIEDLIKVVIK